MNTANVLTAEKAAELKKLSVSELEDKLKELKTELFNLRFQHAINQLDNPQKIVETRKTIARLMTVIREKEIQAASDAQ